MFRFILTVLMTCTLQNSVFATQDEFQIFDENIGVSVFELDRATNVFTFGISARKPVQSIDLFFTSLDPAPINPAISPTFLLDLSTAQSANTRIFTELSGPPNFVPPQFFLEASFPTGFELIGDVELLRFQSGNDLGNFSTEFTGTFSDGTTFRSSFAAVPEPSGTFLFTFLLAALSCNRRRLMVRAHSV